MLPRGATSRPKHYAIFVVDPEGNPFEAVCQSA